MGLQLFIILHLKEHFLYVYDQVSGKTNSNFPQEIGDFNPNQRNKSHIKVVYFSQQGEKIN